MTEIGYYSLALAWVIACYGCFAGPYAAFKNKTALTISITNSTIVIFFLNLSAFIALAVLFAENRYENQYVWQHSSAEMPLIYKVSAIWGGMDGSLLLWSLLLSTSSAIAASAWRKYDFKAVPWIFSILNLGNLFFLSLLLFFCNPFRYLGVDQIPEDGNGLNPLLQNPYMAIHPPMLYLGFTNLAIPFAFCMAYLIAGNTTSDWIKLTRHWTLIAWGFLTIGITLGGHWAYLELGWGGFWAWDPVENSSFLPWLTATAYLHSVMVQERKGMLKFWNVFLIALTYSLTIFGTFLTRSGIVQSVHAFASTDIGWIFLIYLASIVIITIATVIYRWQILKSEREIQSFFSRECAILLNNLILVSICFATLWGVMFPVFSEALTGERQTVGIPFFNAINVPLFLILLGLMAIGTMLPWRETKLINFFKFISIPLISATLLGLLLIFIGIKGFYPILAYSLAWLILITIMQELHRSAKIRSKKHDINIASASIKVIQKNHIRYAGYLVHVGVAIAAIGISASMAHKFEEEFTLAPKESIQIGRFELTLDDLQEISSNNYVGLHANTNVSSKGKFLKKLAPEMRRYFPSGESTSEVALLSSLKDDFYLVLSGYDEASGKASFKVFINPLQIWLWIGVLITAIGTVIALIPSQSSREIK